MLIAADRVTAQQHDRAALEKLRADLIEVEMTIERLKRLVPPTFDLPAERAAIHALAEKAKLSPVEVKVIGSGESLKSADGQPLPITIDRLEISGVDTYDAVHFFLSMLRLRPRLIGIESVRFDAVAGDRVRYVARLAYPSWGEETSAPQPSPARDVVTVARERLAMLRWTRDAVVSYLAQLRSDRHLDALASLTAAVDEHPIALRSVRLDGAMSIEGSLVGAAARALLTEALKKAGMLMADGKWSPSGPCQTFAVTSPAFAHGSGTGKTGITDTAALFEDLPDYAPGRHVFDAESATFCSDEPSAQSPRRVVVPGQNPGESSFLRLRDVDVVDLFFVINDLLPENFIVDDDVTGRITLDVSATASVDDVLRAIATTGVVIGSPPLRRVSRKASTTTPSRATNGPPLSLVLRKANVTDVLCLLREVMQKEITMPAGVKRRVSIFAFDVPADLVLDALHPRSTAGSVNPCERPGAPASRLARHRFSFESLEIAEVRLAGIAQVGETWKAYARVPGKGVMALAPDQRLFDGVVKSIGPNGVTFLSDSKGEKRVALAP